jgi:hypothetical protein
MAPYDKMGCLANLTRLFRVILRLTIERLAHSIDDAILLYHVLPPRLSIEECRRFLRDERYTDEQVVKIRDQFYAIAEVVCATQPNMARAFLVDYEPQERASIQMESGTCSINAAEGQSSESAPE